MRADRLLNAAILVLATLIGVVTFAYPFLSPGIAEMGPQAVARPPDAPLVALMLTLLCVVIVVANLTSHQMSARSIAVLAVLTAVNAALRAVPGPAGFSAVFFLLGLCGYVYGATFGFLLGVVSLLVSALMGGGVGPWLPYQMFAAGWMGLTSGWLPDLRRRKAAELSMLALWTLLWGFLFGVIMNLWFWPYLSAAQVTSSATWQRGLRLAELVRRYAVFYVATSAWWDAWRAVGNAGLVLVVGAPLIAALRRFEHVLGFQIEPFDPSRPSPDQP